MLGKKNHEKIQPLDHFFGLYIYYWVKNKSNIKWQCYNIFFFWGNNAI